MATPHAAKKLTAKGLTAKNLARPLALTLTALAAAGVLTAPASASPQLTIGQAESRINALNTQAEKITEAYDAARDNLVVLQRQQHVAADQLNREQGTLDRLRVTIGSTANFAYRNGGLGGVVDLADLTSPSAFLDSRRSHQAIGWARRTASRASFDWRTTSIRTTCHCCTGRMRSGKTWSAPRASSCYGSPAG